MVLRGQLRGRVGRRRDYFRNGPALRWAVLLLRTGCGNSDDHMKPRLFLDTQICIDIGKRVIDRRMWARVWRHITSNFQYVISPLTLCEVLTGVASGTDRYFNENREALRVLVPPNSQKRFLGLPAAFVLQTVLCHKIEAQGFAPKDFDTWVKVVLRAPNKHALEAGDVPLGVSSTQTYGFDSSLHVAQLSQGEHEHVQELHKLRNGILEIPSSLVWAAAILVRQGMKPSHEECQRVARSLDAAFQFDMSLYSHARTSNYNFEKHKSDWIDEQQLYYLSDPQVYFLTRDGRLREWTKASTQASRILDFDSFPTQIAA